MKTISSKLFIQLLFFLICYINVPIISNAAIRDTPPVEVKKTSKSKKQAAKNKRLLKKKAAKKVKAQQYKSIIVGILLVFGLLVLITTSIILIAIGLGTANPALWITGICLIGAAILAFFIWLFVVASN